MRNIKIFIFQVILYVTAVADLQSFRSLSMYNEVFEIMSYNMFTWEQFFEGHQKMTTYLY